MFPMRLAENLFILYLYDITKDTLWERGEEWERGRERVGEREDGRV